MSTSNNMSGNTIRLVVGLGNPGRKYQHNRHNIGEMLLHYLPFSRELSWQGKFKGVISSWVIKGERVYFLFPQTYMNLSGESVIAAATFYGIDTGEILVIHDELDLPFGQLMFKQGGGLAGHNGLRSIAEHFGAQNFFRLRLGISRPEHPSFDVADWVLSNFSGDDEIKLKLFLEKAAEALVCFFEHGMGKASSLYNKKDLVDQESR
ncbi:MAG: aminoacyl-tRNA hydrolase [Oligoflexia bacterium]|nr:aminoacyl-tRNA hydrolase [Oligoflexia bacterium]